MNQEEERDFEGENEEESVKHIFTQSSTIKVLHSRVWIKIKEKNIPKKAYHAAKALSRRIGEVESDRLSGFSKRLAEHFSLADMIQHGNRLARKNKDKTK